MSHFVYIANPGFENDPISDVAWLEAARKLSVQDNGCVLAETKRKGHDPTFYIHLAGRPRQRLDLHPYGLIQAQEPDRELVELMFKLAERLAAAVYSERRVAYKSPDDWEKRTRNYRERRISERSQARRVNRRKWLLIASAAALGIVAGLISSKRNG